MRALVAAVLMSTAVVASAADRIQSMGHLEQCVYRARLAAAGSYTRASKTAETCEGIKILWHGDETENEIEYVRRWTCVGFESGTNPVVAGDRVYAACVKETGT